MPAIVETVVEGSVAPTIEAVSAEAIGIEERAALAALVYAAVPQFYGLLPVPKAQALALIADQIGLAGTETETCYCTRVQSEIVSVLSLLAGADLPGARRAGLFELLRGLGEREAGTFLAALAVYEGSVEPVPPEGIYLARLGAVPSTEALGHGAKLLQTYLAQAARGRYYLHVHRDNLAATWLYRKLGFRDLSDARLPFRVMLLDR